MREIVIALVDDAAQQIEKLRVAVERSDARECVRLAHSARGACSNVGAASLAALFSAIEQQAELGALSQCVPSIQSLPIELEKLRVESNSL